MNVFQREQRVSPTNSKDLFSLSSTGTTRSVINNERKAISRRRLLQGALGASGLVLFTPKVINAFVSNQEQNRENSINTSSSVPYGKILEDTLNVYAAMIFLGKALNSIGIKYLPTGAPKEESQISPSPSPFSVFSLFGVAAIVVAPLTEEFLFRKLPLMIEEGVLKGSKTWSVGILSSVVFGYAHNIVCDSAEDTSPGLRCSRYNAKLVLDSFPVQKIIQGLYFWYLMKEFGYKTAVFSHSITNGTSLVLIQVLSSKFADTKNDNQKHEQTVYESPAS